MKTRSQSAGNPILRAGAYLWRHFKEEFRPILFSAALAVVLGQLGMLKLFTKLSLLVVANLAAPDLPDVQAATRAPVVLYLDEQRWFDRYREQSPLDRCQMADDLAAILARSPRTLAVDFDLSPGLNDARPECQERLDRLLDQHAGHLVLLAPLRVSSQPLFERKRQWTLARCQKGMAFGDGALDESLGIVIDAPANPYALASQVHARGKESICTELAHDEGAETWLRKRTDGDEGQHAAGHGGASPVNFSGFARTAAAMPLDDPRVSRIGNWAERDVFFGGDYGASRDDAFLTPLGKLPGVAVHAALRHSLAEPVDELPHRYGFVVDVLIAFMFSLLISFFWKQYVKLRAGTGLWRETSTVVVAGFCIVYLGMVFALFQLAADLFTRGILIAPLLIALSMLADGFVTGPITAYQHAGRHSHNGHAHTPEPILDSGFWPMVLLLGMAIGVALLFHHLALPWLSLLAVSAVLAERVASARSAPAAAGQAQSRHAATAVLAASGTGALPSRHGGGWAERLGLLAAPASGADWAGLCVFALRQAVFWAVVIHAMFLILNH